MLYYSSMAITDFFKKKEKIDNFRETKKVLVDGIQKAVSYGGHKEVIPIKKETETIVSLDEKETLAAKENVEIGSLPVSPDENASPHSASVSLYSEEAHQVEAILEDGLSESYDALSPRLQEEFRASGEKTAMKIVELLHGAKIKIRKILALIRAWLGMLPGVSQLFIEQEARNKAKKIFEMKEKNNFQ